jgi:hypothetical protein
MQPFRHVIWMNFNQQLSVSISASLQYLRRHLSTSGRFNYIYDAESDLISTRYNIVRHAGTVGAVAHLLNTSFDDGCLGESCESMLKYLSTYMNEISINDNKYMCITSKNAVKLGASALSLVAYAVLMQKRGQRGIEGDILSKLAEFILSQQRPDGTFVSKRYIVSGEVSPFESVYYPGQAILALLFAFRITKEPRYLAGAFAGARARLQLRRNRGLDTSQVDHWFMIALSEMQSIDGNPCWADSLRNIALDSLNWLRQGSANRRLELDNATTTELATHAEGMIAAFQADRRMYSQRGVTDLRVALSAIVRCVLDRQITRERFPHLNARGDGGFIQTKCSSKVRIDYVQHALAAAFGTYQLIHGGTDRESDSEQIMGDKGS